MTMIAVLSYVACLVVAIALLFALFTWFSYRDKITMVLDKDVIRKVSAGYFASLTSADLYARGQCPTREACHSRYVDAVQSNVTLSQRMKLIRWTRRADACARRGGMWTLAKMRWNVCILDASAENGYPHTLGSIIFLPTTCFSEWKQPAAITVLLHEKLHVFQRAYPDRCQRLYTHYWGYRPASPQLRRSIHLRRSNPDIDDRMYHQGEGGPVCSQVYNSDHPSSLADSHILCNYDHDDAYEHPNEAMAYVVSEMLASDIAGTGSTGSKLRAGAKRWIQNDANFQNDANHHMPAAIK